MAPARLLQTVSTDSTCPALTDFLGRCGSLATPSRRRVDLHQRSLPAPHCSSSRDAVFLQRILYIRDWCNHVSAGTHSGVQESAIFFFKNNAKLCDINLEVAVAHKRHVEVLTRAYFVTEAVSSQ